VNATNPSKPTKSVFKRRVLAKRDLPYYLATFDQLKTHAFGRNQVLPGRYEIIVFQVGIKPPRWNAKPDLGRLPRPWCAGSAVELMAIVERSFGRIICEWVRVDPPRGLGCPVMAPIDRETHDAIATERMKRAINEGLAGGKF
jgi:hypothetical protein